MSTITLPSGAVGEVRGLRGKDGRYLANESLVRDGEVMDFMLTHCWARTLDAGPYDLKGKDLDWNKALLGDRFAALIAIREASYPGVEYVIPLQCTRRGTCGKKFEWEIDLAKILTEKVQRLREEDATRFREGNVFEETIPFTSTVFRFRLHTGDSSKRAQKFIESRKTGPKKMQEEANPIVDAILGSVLEIEGVPRKRDAMFAALEDCELRSLDAMVPLMQGHDCGVDTAIEVFCPHCGGEMTIELPFDRAFFLPYSSAARQKASKSSPQETTTAPSSAEAVVEEADPLAP